jgi:hypothetical protein
VYFQGSLARTFVVVQDKIIVFTHINNSTPGEIIILHTVILDMTARPDLLMALWINKQAIFGFSLSERAGMEENLPISYEENPDSVI